jgi:DNA-binding FadR family transcriptional regulator
LRILASEHLLETRRGVNGGTFVKTPTPDAIAASLAVGLGCMAGANELTVDELLEARLLLEVPAARLGARRAEESQLQRLLEASGPIEGSDRFSTTAGFHMIVLESTGNRLLPLMTRPIFEVLENRFARRRASRRFWVQVDRDHRHIAEAIIDRDPDAAAARMHTHLESLAETYQRIDLGSVSR